MAETSFPVLEKPMSDKQWRSVTMGIGDGILDEGGNPYSLSDLNNQTNTAVIQTDSVTGFAHAILKGFYHKIESPLTVQLPAVSVETKYFIVLCYDPLNAQMPVSLKVVTALDASGGKAYLLLHEVTRRPNELLKNATVRTSKPIITPMIQVNTPANLPPAKSVLWGTKAWCWQTGEGFRSTWGGWEPISGTKVGCLQAPGWKSESPTKAILLQPVPGGWQATLALALTRLAEGYTIGTEWEGQGNTLGTFVPEGFRPQSEVRTTTVFGEAVLAVKLTSGGQIQLRASDPNKKPLISTGQAIHFQMSWFVEVNQNSRN